MTNTPSEIGKINENTLRKTMEEWKPFMDLLEKEAPGDPRLEQCAHIKNSALQSLNHAMLSLSMPNGADMASRAMEQAQEKYNQALMIRADIIRDKILTMTNGLREAIQAQMPAGAGQGDPRVRPLEALLTITDELRTTESNPFFRLQTDRNGKQRITVAFDKVKAYRDQLGEIKKTGTLLSPAIGPILNRLETSLDFVANADPIRNGYVTMQSRLDTMTGSFDSRPLRIIAVLGGGLLTALGGGIMIKDRILKGEWGQVTWPTYLWAGVVALALKPSLLSGGLTKNIQSLQSLNEIGKQGLMAINAFKGKEGALAIEEVAELQKNGKLKPLLSQANLSNAFIGSVTGGNTPLSKVLATLSSDAERGQTLREIAKQTSGTMKEVLVELVRTRDKIDFT